MTVAEINVGDNIKVLDKLAKKDFITPLEKKSIQENNDAIKILLERLHHRRPGRKTSEKDKKEGSSQGEGKKRIKTDLPENSFPRIDIPIFL